MDIIAKIEPHLGEGKPAITCELTPDEAALAKQFICSPASRLYSRRT